MGGRGAEERRAIESRKSLEVHEPPKKMKAKIPEPRENTKSEGKGRGYTGAKVEKFYSLCWLNAKPKVEVAIGKQIAGEVRLNGRCRWSGWIHGMVSSFCHVFVYQ